MKKKVLLIAALFTAGFSFAQDQMTSKKGTPILPEAGDYAIGFDAAGLTNYAGNLLNGDANNSFNALNLQRPQTIYGKYFKDANTAYRGMLQLDFGSTTNRNVVQDLTPGAAANATVEDETTTSNLGITIGGGLEFRRGKGRLQGVYGPMAMISLGSSSTENTFGNTLQNSGAPSRVTETSTGSTFGFAVGGFAGVEYFFAPKISIGGEIMWTIAINSQANGESTSESLDANNNVVSTTTETGGSSSFNVGTVPMANLNLNFHF